jgi:hypothetical protein
MIILKHTESLIFMLIIKLRQQALILDKSWMRKHDVSYHEKTNTIEFYLEFCTHSKRIRTTNKEKNIHFEKKSFLNQSDYFKFDNSIKNSNKFFDNSTKNSRKSSTIVIKVLSRKEHHFDQSAISLSRKDKKSIKSINRIKDSKTIKDFRFNLNELKISNPKEKKSLLVMNIAMIEASTFNMMNKRKNVNLFFVILKDVKKHLEKHNKSNIVIRDVLSFEYHEFLDVFDKKAFNIFVSHRLYDHKIVLKRNAIFEYTFLYKMFEKELKIVKKYLEDNLEKRFIIASRSSFVSSVMFMKKTNESLRFCVDYRKLNQLTKKNRYSLSLIDETLTHLEKTKYFIKLNIRQVFHRIRIADVESKDLITFRIKFDAYKYWVLSFELCNESATYQHYMNDVFFDYLDDFVFAYINDILIYSNSKAEHIKHVKQMLQRLRNAKLQADINKCEFFVHEIKYLDLIVERDEIKMNSKKIEIILQWSISQNLKQIQKFLRFCNFYRRFIRNFAKIVKSLIKLIRKDVIFNWNEACKIAFELLKRTVIETSILAHFDLKKQIYIKSDSFDFVSAEVLSQMRKNDELHSMTFFSKNLASIECNYEIYDKKLLTIVRCFEQWRSELLFTEFDVSIKMLTNHKNLKYFMITKQLNRRQSKWAQFLANFHFVITYLFEKSNEKADSLIERIEDVFDKKNDRQKQQNQILFSSERFDKDLQAVELIIIFESNRLSLMQEMHDRFASNHSEINRTIKLFKRNHRWSEMIRDVKQYIRNCHTCKKIKTARNKYHELLNSLSMSNRSWTNIILDFVTELLDNRDYNAILMIVDKLSKMHHYISCTTDENEITIEKTVKLLIQHVWKLHELFTTMISDKDSSFVFVIWDTICRMLKIKAKLFIAFHSETNEQSEIFNQEMKRYLRVYVNHQQNDWANWLSMIEYVSNASMSTTTHVFSFLANYEFEPQMSFDQMKFDENTTKNRINKFRKKEIVFIMKNIWKFAKKHMKKSQQNQTIYANRHRISASDYQVENQIWLSFKNIQIDRSFKKLDHKMLESFKILKKKDSSYKLQLSVEMNIHSVFHISLLRKNLDDFLSRQIISSLSSIVIDDEQKFDVENIVDFRLVNRAFNKRLQYKVRWIEHSSDRKWYSTENFDHAKEIVTDYHDRYLNKFESQSIIVALITNQYIDWIQQNIKNVKELIQKILDRMKKEMKKELKSSIFSVDRNITNIKAVSQDSFVTKTISVERILTNQKSKENSVTISCQSFNQMIIKKARIDKRD